MNYKLTRPALNRSLSLFLVLILIGLALTPVSAPAWNNVGHRAVAELVWRHLSAAERRGVTELLKQHPHYDSFLAANVPKGVATNEWAFLTAAIWPDWVRPAKKGQPPKPESVTKYNLYPHAIGHPFLRAGETDRSLLEGFYIAKPNAEMVLSNSLVTLKNRKASAHDRAVSLCWVVHLFGDLHQPLHAANRVTRERPKGEGLGGDHFVLNTQGRRVDLHSFWDQLPGTEPSYQAIATLADRLESAPELKPARLPEYRKNQAIPAWVQESYRAAVDFAYAEDRLQFLHADALKAAGDTAPVLPTMKSDYAAEAERIAHRRLMLAALRLTTELKKVW